MSQEAVEAYERYGELVRARMNVDLARQRLERVYGDLSREPVSEARIEESYTEVERAIEDLHRAHTSLRKLYGLQMPVGVFE